MRQLYLAFLLFLFSISTLYSYGDMEDDGPQDFSKLSSIISSDDYETALPLTYTFNSYDSIVFSGENGFQVQLNNNNSYRLSRSFGTSSSLYGSDYDLKLSIQIPKIGMEFYEFSESSINIYILSLILDEIKFSEVGIPLLISFFSAVDSADYVLKWYREVLISLKNRNIKMSETDIFFSKFTSSDTLFKKAVLQQALGVSLDNPNSYGSSFMTDLLEL